jgi:hypothetical protein
LTARPEPVRVEAGFVFTDEAVGALIKALGGNDAMKLHRIFGPYSESLINSADSVADDQRRADFLAAYNPHKVAPAGNNRSVLDVGKDN